jgi:hypothetical protein
MLCCHIHLVPWYVCWIEECSGLDTCDVAGTRYSTASKHTIVQRQTVSLVRGRLVVDATHRRLLRRSICNDDDKEAEHAAQMCRPCSHLTAGLSRKRIV